jgi:hypothetical protein
VNILFLSPHFPPPMPYFCAALAEHGHCVLGIGDAPPKDLPESLDRSLSQYLYVPDMLDLDTMVRALGLLIYHYGRIDRIESLNEHWLGVEAALREAFNVPGLRPAELERARDKRQMRAIFEAHNIPCARGRAIESGLELEAAALELGLPVIVKPAHGVGARGVEKLHSLEDLRLAADHWLEPALVEEPLDGELMSYDGLCDGQGHIVFEHCTVTNKGIMEITHERGPVHFYSLREPPQALLQLGRKVVSAFGLRAGFFHFEAFVNAAGQARALEINLRPPGGLAADMMNYSFDFDVFRLWAMALAGHSLRELKPQRRYFCAHVGRRRWLDYQWSREAIRERWSGKLCYDRALPPPFDYAMGDEVFMLRSPDLEDLRAAIKEVEAVR